MASSAPENPDFPVTVKVSFQGNNRRLTLPLSEVGSPTLINKIRQLLSISPDANAVFARHSDSAAAYVELEPNNAAVWRQLFRAAKAKRKLKLRVTLHDSEVEEDELDHEENTGPKPVTVEDEPEQEGKDFASAKGEEDISPINGSQDIKAADVSSTQATESTQAYDSTLANDSTQASDSTQAIDSTQVNDLLEKAMSELHLGSEKTAPEVTKSPVATMCGAAKRANFAVCCNNCDSDIPDAHYHCSTCDEGDFDLCPACVELGVTCYNSDHWLLKRFVRGNFILVSTTERVSPKPKVKTEEVEEKPQPLLAPAAVSHSVPSADAIPPSKRWILTPTRTCNSCVKEFVENEFLHCLYCDDFDLCKTCFAGDDHGHHPQHAFAPAVEGTPMPSDVQRRLAPGRDEPHHAICDGCDKFIFGIRHKCLDCPDWDYCADCIPNASFVHPEHRFVPILKQMAELRTSTAFRPCHYGICCDGPLCNSSRQTYIVGERFKCAVCHDTDFCANCEASPANSHNKTHPLIKFKTPVRRVEVKTNGEDEKGQKMPVMGDRLSPKCPRADKAYPSACLASDVAPEVVSKPANQEEPTKDDSQQKRQAAMAFLQRSRMQELQAQHAAAALQRQATFALQRGMIEAQRRAIAGTPDAPIAIFERDTVADGTVMLPNQVFEQTWVLRNGGNTSWPAGCSVKFVGGDYMGHIDSSTPVGIYDLVSASESTVCYDSLAPGQEFPFTVLLRTPAREGKVISYWRLQSSDGMKFGHRLWCDVSVQKPKTHVSVHALETPEHTKASQELLPSKDIASSEVRSEKFADSCELAIHALETTPEDTKAFQELLPSNDIASSEVRPEKTADGCEMIFPKVDNKKPTPSDVEEAAAGEVPSLSDWPSSPTDDPIDEYEVCGDETWAEDFEEDMMTDEEFDILNSSDEEYIDEQEKAAAQK